MAESSQQTSTIDVAQQQLGDLYAKALLESAQKTGQADAVIAELDSLVNDVLNKLPAFEASLFSIRLAHEEKEKLLDKAFAGKMSQLILNFLKVLSRNGRLSALRAMQSSARRVYNDMRGRVAVQVTTAEPLSDQQAGQISQSLRTALKKDIDLQPAVDPDLIGGLVVRVGDTVFDGSVKSRLSGIRRQALEQTARQIQAGVDRFTTAE